MKKFVKVMKKFKSNEKVDQQKSKETKVEEVVPKKFEKSGKSSCRIRKESN
jgi:hypothetical protein